ncbi:hypothetical protein ACQI5H_07015 [Mycobacterium heidelbergense]|uniref:hypothetical protein n=1 Tax=Mycobacterium heidelbergense TaxID=53376 RepID=UPI003CF5904D
MPDVRPGAFEALDYQAPFLIEKLVKDSVVETSEEACALFTELKRYLVLTHVDQTKTWKMHSAYVDEVWHQFVLFTVEYSRFCTKYFGTYRHHFPSNAPGASVGAPPEATLAEFGDRYRDIFGMDLPQVWDDSRCVTPHRRIVNRYYGQLALGSVDGMAELTDRNGRVFLSVNDIARDALRFIAGTGAFYVRELPGDLTEEEKIALVAGLVETKVLRVG